MDNRERSIKEDIVRITLVHQWTKEDIVFELLSSLTDEQLHSLWSDISLALQDEQDEKSEAYA